MGYPFIRKSHQHAGIKRLSFFVVAVVTAMFVYMKRQPPRQPQQSRPPMGNRNRTIELSTVPVRAHCPSGGGGIIPFGSASTTLYSLCPLGHGCYIDPKVVDTFPEKIFENGEAVRKCKLLLEEAHHCARMIRRARFSLTRNLAARADSSSGVTAL